MNQKLYTRREAAELFKVDQRTISNWTNGKFVKSPLKVMKTGGTVRITQTSIDNFIEENGA